MWFDDRAIANIFGLCDLKKKYRVTYDSESEDAFIVHDPVKGNIKFSCTEEGLYAFTPSDSYRKNLKKNNTTVVTNCLVASVEENKKGYTERQFKRAKEARALYHKVGTPTVENFKGLLRQNLIQDCPITIEDVIIAEKIFGPDISSLKGKSTRTRPNPVVDDVIDIPPEIKEENKELVLCMDTMFINKEIFLTAIDKSIKFRSLVPLKDKSPDEYYAAIDIILRHYNKADFRIKRIECDREYTTLMNPVQDGMDIQMNYTNTSDHVPEAERNNRTIKERVRATFHRLPYKMLPRILIRYLAMTETSKLNYFPVKGGVSKYYSPRMILMGEHLNYTKHFQVPFGAYVQASNEPTPTNSQLPRTLDGIYLRPVTNIQGGHEILDLNTGKVITRRKVTEIPITKLVIQAVEDMAKREGFKSLKFKNRNNVVFHDTGLIAGVDDNKDETEYDEEEEDEEYEDEEEEDVEEEPQEYDEVDRDEVEELMDDAANPADYRENNDNEEEEEEEEEVETTGVVSEETEDDDDEETVESETRRSTRTSKPVERLEPKMKGQSYHQKAVRFADETKLEDDHNLVTQTSPNPNEDTEYRVDLAMLIARYMVDIHLTTKRRGASFLQQYLLKQGLKKYGKKGYDGALKEMDQLHRRSSFSPISIKSMSSKERKRAMKALMFLAEKRTGEVKGRMVYNGKPTREWLDKQDSASPTAALESIFLLCLVDAKEGRDVMSTDIPNAFVQTEMPTVKDGEERIIMKITGVLVDMLVQLAPEVYGPYVVFERGEKVIYVQVMRAIYGMLQSALLWYKKFRKDLEGHGFKFNPYDPCVANKKIAGSQQTIRFHVDDLMSSHRKRKVNEDFAKWLNSKYGSIKPVEAVFGNEHDYLGMTFVFDKKRGTVKVDMIRYVENMLEDYYVPLKKTDTAFTPAGDNLLNKGQSKKLEKRKAEQFHTTVARGLFLSKRGRPDIHPTIAVLCTRVREPTEADAQKLLRMMKYLNGTKKLVLTISADSLSVVKWYVDASFAVHPDFKSHTGAVMTMGKGAVQTLSRKQKLNTRSSTEAELVGADDAAGMILWTKLFLDEQGYGIKKNILYQDNKSAILLETNGRQSAGKRSRAINVRYFFLTDQVEKGNVLIEYCPTDEMWGDFMTKPLQGAKFKKFRDDIMGLS